MANEIITSIVAASGVVVLAGATYWFTKKREREAELRKEKLEHYKDFVASLSGIVSNEGTPETQRAFARACNKLNLVAPQAVVKALQDFQQEIKVTNPNKNDAKHDQLMSKLFYEMRKDLQITPKDKDTSFVFGLWASGSSSEDKKS
jgi:dsDNA-specific endonuclease/ATPase MutS2